jgi:hypothetical protein
MQLTHSLKGAWFQPFNLSSEKLASKFAFKLTHMLESTWFQPVNLSSEKTGFKVCFHIPLVPLRRGVRRDGAARARAHRAVAGGHRRVAGAHSGLRRRAVM